MKLGKGHGTEVGYNVQTAVDSKHKLIIANDVTNDTGDRDWLSPMALQAKTSWAAPSMPWRTLATTMARK